MTMPHDGPRDVEPEQVPGIAGGPGPTPPGFDDGTPRIEAPAPETPPEREGGEEEHGEGEADR